MIEYIFKEVMVGKFSKLKEVNKPRIYDSEVSEDSHMCVCVCVCVCVYTLAWRIPGTAEPGGLPSMGSHRVRHD